MLTFGYWRRTSLHVELECFLECLVRCIDKLGKRLLGPSAETRTKKGNVMLFAKKAMGGNCISIGFYLCASYGPSHWNGF